MKAKRWALYAVAALAAWFLVHILFITIDGLRNSYQKSDAAVVFGNKVNEDGTLSPRLKARLDKSIELYNNGDVAHIIVSGGLGKEGHYEARKMRDYLREQHIPEWAIIVDDYGDNTLKSVQNTIGICKQTGFKSVIAVSQYYHITRIKTMFKQEGGVLVEGASPAFFEWRDFYSVTREFFAFYAYLL